MLSKTIKFDDDVLTVLRAMDWQDEGKLGIITGGQLERKLYEKVNKALTAMGGKWNRKAGGHVFTFDPRPSVDGLLENGSLTVERDGFFETPRAVVEKMLEFVPVSVGDVVLEPSAGMGAIAEILRERGARVICIEKNKQRCDHLVSKHFETYNADFLSYVPNGGEFKAVVMNPPFEELQDVDHVQHAYDLLADGGKMVSVMAESAFFRSDRKAVAFREWLDGVGGWSYTLPDGSFKESGTGVNARLVVIKK